MKGTVRPMTAADLPQVAALERHAPDGWSEAQLAEELAAPFAVCLVLCEDAPPQRLVGFCSAQLAADEATLNAITVAPSARRQGCAGRLLAALEQRLAARGARTVYLEVRAHNAPALALYRRAGFVATGRRPHFYTAPPEDALTMKKCLPAPPAARPGP